MGAQSASAPEARMATDPVVTPHIAARRSAPSDHDWDRLLAQAITGRSARAVYQPIVDLTRLEIVGYEGLIRFDGAPGLGPDRWFAEARARGIEGELDAVAVSKVLEYRDDLPEHCFLSINLEPRSLTSAALQRVLRGAGRLDGVVLELTEHARIESYSALEPLIDRYRAAGAEVAVDDAGAGYAGLQHVLALRPHFLKLDRSLVEGVHRDGAKRALIEMMGIFADRIDARMIAEGVELLDEALCLRELGVPLAQGYLFARPGDPWVGIEPDVTRHLHTGVSLPDADGVVVELVESAPTASIDDLEHASTILGDDDDADLVVLIDRWQRPVGLFTPAAALEGRPVNVTRVDANSPVTDIAARLMNRAPRHRFDPVAVINDGGQLLGVVRMERVVTMLTRLAR